MDGINAVGILSIAAAERPSERAIGVLDDPPIRQHRVDHGDSLASDIAWAFGDGVDELGAGQVVLGAREAFKRHVLGLFFVDHGGGIGHAAGLKRASYSATAELATLVRSDNGSHGLRFADSIQRSHQSCRRIRSGGAGVGLTP